MKHFPTDFQSQTPTPNHVFAAADNNGTACKFSLFNLWSYIKTTYIDSLLAGKAASSHTHAQSDITGLSTALADKMDTKTIDSTPTASSTNLVTSGGVKAALDGKANVYHDHAAIVKESGYVRVLHDSTNNTDEVKVNANTFVLRLGHDRNTVTVNEGNHFNLNRVLNSQAVVANDIVYDEGFLKLTVNNHVYKIAATQIS